MPTPIDFQDTAPTPPELRRAEAVPARRDAIVQAEACLAIDASPQRVWHLLVDIDAWPAWNDAVTWVRSRQAPAVGATFDWKSQGFVVTSTLIDMKPATRLAWTGRAFGTRALHVWEIEPAERGVVVRSYESFSGWLPRLMPKTFQKKLDQTLPAWLATLRREAERVG